MPEILAPVGSYSALIAAIYSKADAVYLGLSKFNARQKAENFNENNIKEVVDLCHLHGVKVYITFNTCIKNKEFEEFEKQVQICADANVDAFIITDLGTLDIFRKYNIPMHASTQLGIHNYEGAKIAKDLGFNRVVLSRETSIKDIIEIKKLGIEIEYFVHGALCVSFSGGCLLSSFLSGDSGNRGLCKQPCRLRYKSSINKKEAYYLSPSDQCLIEQLSQLIKAGVDSFKIEGRLKSAHYVGEVVKQYKAAVSNQYIKDYKSFLKKAYNRGDFTSGYNFDLTKDIMSIDIQGNKGESIGKIKNIKGKTLIIYSKRGVFLNDGLKIIHNGKEIGGFLVDNVKKDGDLYYINTKNSYPINANVHLTLDNTMVENYKNINIYIPIDINYEFIVGKPLKIIAKVKDLEITEFYDVVECSINKPINKEYVESKLSETGNSKFKINSIVGAISENAFYPASKLKIAKRNIMDKMEQLILSDYVLNKQKTNNINQLEKFNNINIKRTLVEFSDINVINLLDLNKITPVLNIRNILANYDINIIKNKLIYNNIEKIWLKLPKILRYDDMNIVKKFIADNLNIIEGIVVENIGHLDLCLKYNLAPILGIGMNVYNEHFIKNIGINNAINSIELSKEELTTSYYTYVFGKVVLMTLSHCPIQLNTGCTCKNCEYKGNFYYNNYEIERIKIFNCYFDLCLDNKINLTNIYKFNKKYINLDLQDVDTYMINKINDNLPIEYNNSTLGHYYLSIK